MMLVDFNLTLLNLTPKSSSETHLQVQAAPQKEEAIFFFYEAPCSQHFHSVLICGEQSLSYLISFIVVRVQGFIFDNAKNTRGTFKTLLNI